MSQEPQVAVSRQQRRPMGKFIILGVIAVLLLVFVFQNTAKVSFGFLFFDFTWPMWLMLLITLLIGFVVGFLTSAMLRRRRRRERRA